ncbi:uncharacterized protein LOC133035872 [Cannabis sativa]|uniref:uncharacterized protein LOC133035872 n=1 Tax=Cannabis sativa TaxID=3483 RepID=UPI0029CA9DA5|nr:uncharacterized protein LOC133035872 [Cannabis sativa]
MPTGLNDTHLVLIPKKKNLSTMGDLRPIALCNVSYKILSKVLANRMRVLINHVISPTQSPFIPCRLISDNIMIGFEIMHYLKWKTKGKKGFMAMKLDMSKAYDRVEWDYLYAVMHRFSSLIKKFEDDHVIQGCRVAKGAPPITHMLFDDDSYLFCQANPNTAVKIKQMLHSFELASEATDGSLYLGLPNIIGRKKTVILGFLKNKIINCLNSWNGKFLSRAGKEVLLKSVIQSLPTYAMSVFLIPLETCQEIEKIMANFWWKTSSAKGQGIIWMSWDRMATHKHSGGMRFHHLHDFNLAMLAKQGWSRVFKAKYYPQSDFLTANLGNNPSFVWRSIWSAQNLVKLGCRRTIGNGITTNILKHPWLPDLANPYVSSVAMGLENHTVSSLLDTHDTSWDYSLVNDMFNPRDAHLILGIPLSSIPAEDCWSWKGEKSYFFSVRSAYDLLQISKHGQQRQSNSGFWHKFWHLKIPLKVKNFMWRAVTNALPTCLKLLLGAMWVHHSSDASSTIDHWLKSTFEKYAWTTLDHWRSAQDKSSLLSLSLLQHDNNIECWTKPDSDTVKLNVDGALFEKENAYGFGIVARDSLGRLVDLKAKYHGGNYPAKVVEALGIKEALSWLKDKELNQVEIETNSMVTVQAIFSNQHMTFAFGLIVNDCKSLLSFLNNVNVRFIRRSANRVTHFVARRSRFFSDCSIHRNDFPNELHALLYCMMNAKFQ